MLRTNNLRAIFFALVATLCELIFIALPFGANPHNRVFAASQEKTKFSPAIPPGIPTDIWDMLIPEDNPMAEAKITLGKELFFEKRLSLDNSVNCATCHDPKLAFTDGKPVAEGVGGKKGSRNSPTVLNSMFNIEQFWDGRAKSLEEQAKGPLINPVEMALPSHDAVVVKMNQIPEYVKKFQELFGTAITIDNIAKAIAAFERTQLSGDSPFDRFIAGDKKAINETAKRGWELFQNKGRCITCHEFNASSPFFSDFKYHNIGVGMKATRNFESLAREVRQMAQDGKLTDETLDKISLTEGYSELGRFLVTRQPKDVGSFKTPTLRDSELTAPYMHDGSLKSLKEVLDFYNKGGEPNPNLDGGIRQLDLTPQEISDLEEFMKALTSGQARQLSRP